MSKEIIERNTDCLKVLYLKIVGAFTATYKNIVLN